MRPVVPTIAFALLIAGSVPVTAEPVLIENKRPDKVKVCTYRSDDRSIVRPRKCWKLKKNQKVRWDRKDPGAAYDVRIFGPGVFELPICYRRKIEQNYRLELSPPNTGNCVTAQHKTRVQVRDWNSGDRVLANSGFDNFWYPATVMERRDNRYRVQLDNRKIEWISASLLTDFNLEVAAVVETNWKKLGRWYPVQLTEKADQHVTVKFPDGIQERTPLSLIRIKLTSS